ncbi:nodulin homeobox-like [Helianthus annuus]|uniref:nodulin homeobox-like n=1 Tax=Helianthus annuus TaxID=4232 RepID=UPI000B8F96F4|nr:nodulin homeobox-like [Helianthus annuus]
MQLFFDICCMFFPLSSRTKKVNMVSKEVDEQPCREEMSPQLDLTLAVKELHALSSKDLGELIRDAEDGIVKYVKQDGSSLEISVEILARHLVKYIMEHLIPSKVNEENFKHMLSGLRLLHTLCDIACHHSTLAQVLVEDTSVQDEILNSIFRIIDFLSQSGEKISGSSRMVLLYSALLSSSMYLLKALISSEWQDITNDLLAHSKVDEFTTTAFIALCVVINSLQAKLPDQHIDSRMRSNANDVYCLYHLCESSLQFLQSACKQMVFRERLVKNKDLCGEGVVLQLVQSTLKLSQCEDRYLTNVVYWLKSKALSIMLLLCEAESTSFFEMASSTTQSKELVKTTIFETEVLTRVFLQPQKEFLSTWCSNDHEPIEEENVMDFDSISAAGQVLGLISKSHVQHSTWNNSQGSPTPYAYQRTSLLVKILADLSEEENARFVSDFLECLQTEASKLPGGAAERTAAASRNLFYLLNHAESLTPAYLNAQDVLVLRWFVSQLEQPLAAKESDIHRAMEVHNRARCPSPTHQSLSPIVDDRSGNDDESVPVTMARVQVDYLACNENGENQLSEDTTQLWLSNRRGKLVRAAAKAARVHYDEDNALPEKETGSGPDPNSPDDLLDEDYDPSPSTSQLTHRKHRRRSVSRTKDTVVIPEKCFKFKVGQHVILTDDKGEEVAKGTIHLVKGVWSGKDLEESSSCVVDVEELKVPANKQPPHPTDAGTAFSEARPCEIRMLWKSSELVLIQQQLP